jgi:hypothetical protein
MTRFDFLYVLVSVLIAISISDIALAWGALMKRRTQVQFYWVHVAWTVLVIFLLVQLWWGMWVYRSIETWSFFQMAAIVAEIVLLLLAASVLTPRRGSEGAIDLKAFFYDTSPIFFTLSAVLMLVLAIVNLVVAKHPLLGLENVIRAIAISVAMFGATTRSTLVHSILVGSGFVLLLVFVLTHSAH